MVVKAVLQSKLVLNMSVVCLSESSFDRHKGASKVPFGKWRWLLTPKISLLILLTVFHIVTKKGQLITVCLRATCKDINQISLENMSKEESSPPNLHF